MIDTATTTTCKQCGKPIVHIAGHRRREYCNDTCKQLAYRERKEQPHPIVTNVDDRQQQNIKRIEQYAIECSLAEQRAKERIAELEAEREQAMQGRDQVQRRFTEYVQVSNEQIGKLAGELAKYRQHADLFDRAKMEVRFMHLGEQVEYRPLAEYGLLGGSGYWQGFMRRASDETLLKAIATAEYFLEGLIALRGDPRQRRIEELERQVKDLQARLDSQESVRSTRRKKPAKPQPLPADLVYWRHFANAHNVAQNKVMQAMSAGFVHCVKGDWMVESGYPITEALDAQGRRDFWVQFYASDNFRTCDTCPHTLQS